MDMKICYSSLLLTVVSLCLSLRLEAVSHTAYLEVLEVKKIKNYLQFDKFYYIIVLALSNAPLAQLAEHLTLNQGVQGSNP